VQSVLWEIFHARLTQRTRSLGRPGQNIEHVAELIHPISGTFAGPRFVFLTAVRKTNLGPAKVPEIVKSWQEYPLSAVLCNESLREICSCCLLPLWHNDFAVLYVCCNIFWTNWWHINLVWASIYVAQNSRSQGTLFVHVNKYSSNINRIIRGGGSFLAHPVVNLKMNCLITDMLIQLYKFVCRWTVDSTSRLLTTEFSINYKMTRH